MISTRPTGFHLTFRNGWTISVQIGVGNYCERRDINISCAADIQNPNGAWSDDAEIAIFKGRVDGEWVTFASGDQVAGWVPSATVAELIAALHSAASEDVPEIARKIVKDSERAG